MSAITTHVLDTTRGRPAAGVPVMLEHSTAPDLWLVIGKGVTDADGRARALLPEGASLSPGLYRLVFNTRPYFDDAGVEAFYPHVVIVFEATKGEAHYHVPLLLGPFAYTTYRGS